MSPRHLSVAAAQILEKSPDPTVYGWTPERVWASAAAIVALGAVVVAAWALARARRSGNSRKWAIGSLVAGLVAAVNGVLTVVTADGGPGTGNGIVGGYIAVVVGAAAAVLGWLAVARARR
ncbi:DUF6223 family protein [Stackebrandtia nassauensis]|uniref:Uncharacterized protein n=1 Tax=Stackebrandtia nassauensis (strain DSM 44728 / CIP 108903 / NRRL B-16338 / NBRC 102104 / LLR-40K-21) TaxID=446470 RepID=D3PUE4_STANL|nr:DUF6223 family protein [Stackebrandtia nassauensis]ADD42957.1 conserved hypothetical protein [Stackebrandtia nassauensis DSM 44728]